jgi:hypothetical protein
MNYHYYNNGGDPTVTANNLASFDLWWQTMHNIATKYGFANKPIWVTETGWPTKAGYQVNHIVTPQVHVADPLDKCFPVWYFAYDTSTTEKIYERRRRSLQEREREGKHGRTYSLGRRC